MKEFETNLSKKKFESKEVLIAAQGLFSMVFFIKEKSKNFTKGE